MNENALQQVGSIFGMIWSKVVLFVQQPIAPEHGINFSYFQVWIFCLVMPIVISLLHMLIGLVGDTTDESFYSQRDVDGYKDKMKKRRK